MFYYNFDITSNYYEAILIELKFTRGVCNNAPSLSQYYSDEEKYWCQNSGLELLSYTFPHESAADN